MNRKLFICLQPLQYLQALELKEENDESVLIVLWANKKNQLHKLVDKEQWSAVIWIQYRGTAAEVIKNNKTINKMLLGLGDFDQIIVSSYYNDLMNLIANSYPDSKIIVLEDGNATLTMDHSNRYIGIKFWCKYIICRLFGFDVSAVKTPTLFILERPSKIQIPAIAADVIVNNYRKLRSEVEAYPIDRIVYVISSSFIHCGMMSKFDYIQYLVRLTARYSQNPVKIMLHRCDDKRDFAELEILDNIEIIESTGPLELYFKTKKIKPFKIISAGSAATETLKLIYTINVSVTMPIIAKFRPEFRQDMELLAEHFKQITNVEFL
jgi:hypothetical protein